MPTLVQKPPTAVPIPNLKRHDKNGADQKPSLPKKNTGEGRCSDLDFLSREFLAAGGSTDQPEEFFHDSSPEHTLRGEEWKATVPEIEAHLSSEHRQCPCDVMDAGATEDER